MRYIQASTSQPALLSSTRGAVFLLAVYVTALFLLILSGISLQRSTHEQRMASIACNSQQAFWVAEAGLDHAVRLIRQTPMNTMATTDLANDHLTLTIPNAGTADIWIKQTLTPPTWEQPIPRFAYQVTSVGQTTNSTGTQATLHATLTTNAAMKGMWANGEVTLEHGNWGPPDNPDRPIEYTGDIRSVLGEFDTVTVGYGTTISGNVTIGMPDDRIGYDDLIGPEDLIGPDYDYHGVSLEEADVLPAGRVTGNVNAMPMAEAQLPPLPPQCGEDVIRDLDDSITVLYGQTLLVTDGGIYDHSEAGDGRILICANDITVNERGSLVFRAPAMVYVLSGFSNDGYVYAAIGTAPADLGLTLLVPLGGAIGSDLGKFRGAVYAPEDDLTLARSDADPVAETLGYDRQPYPRALGYIVADGIEIAGVNVSANVSTAGQVTTTPQVTTWYAD